MDHEMLQDGQWLQATHGATWWIKSLETCTRYILLSELKVCSTTRNLQRGRAIHARAVKAGACSCIYVATALVKLYAKCRSMVDAREVFDTIDQPDVVSWTAIILAYAENGDGLVALDLYTKMRTQGLKPDSVTFIAALKACSSAKCLEYGKKIHLDIGYSIDIYVQNSLIDMYANCGSMVHAQQIFDSMKRFDTVSWNTLVFGYAQNGDGVVALKLYDKMRSRGFIPDSLTFVAALKAAVRVKSLDRGRQIHSEIGCHENIYVQNALIDMYAKCGSMLDAQKVFDGVQKPDAFSWNALILGYAENGEGFKALNFYTKMRSQGFVPDDITFVGALKACTSLALVSGDIGEGLDQGRKIHRELGCRLSMMIQNNLIDMYANCGSMVEARKVFDDMEHPDLVSWNTLVSGYAENAEGVVALDLYAKMRSQGFVPDSRTSIAALKACGSLGALASGCKIHEAINTELESGESCNVIVVTCLVDFYAKCGDLAEAQRTFDLNPRTRDLRTWNTLLAGYSRLGDAATVFRLFEEMQEVGFRPDLVTFLCIFTCCSHAGLVDKAKEYFNEMSLKYRLTPTIEHCTCIIHVLSRFNRLDESVALLRSMPCRPDEVAWLTLLEACRKWKNVEIGRLVFQSWRCLDGRIAAGYVLMAHIYGRVGMRMEQEMMLIMKNKLQTLKKASESFWTNELGEVQMFVQA